MYRQRRLPLRPPCSLVGIGEQRFAYLGEARTAVGAVFVGDAFYPKRTRTHGCALTSGSSAPMSRPLQSSFRLVTVVRRHDGGLAIIAGSVAHRSEIDHVSSTIRRRRSF